MNRKKSFLVIVSLGLCLLTAACGYQLRETGKPQGIEIRSLAIPMFESNSTWPGFEGDFTRVVREEFVSHSKFPIVSRNEAHMILIGKIRHIRTKPASYDLLKTSVGGEQTTYEVTNARWLWVRLDAKLVDASTGKVVWEVKSMQEKTTYAVTTDPLKNRYNRRRAVREIAEDLAQRIYQRTTERF